MPSDGLNSAASASWRRYTGCIEERPDPAYVQDLAQI